MKQKEITEFIKKRIRYHRKHFNRYRKEVDEVMDMKRSMKYVSERNLSQLKYSDEQSARELGTIDELELILRRLEIKK